MSQTRGTDGLPEGDRCEPHSARAKHAYERPRVTRLGETRWGRGESCDLPGSSADPECWPGGSAAGACVVTGTTAGADCSSGTTAGTACDAGAEGGPT